MKVFEYVIIFNPKEPDTSNPRIIVGIKTVLASDQQKATLLAARDIPEDYLDRLDQLEVAVRPF